MTTYTTDFLTWLKGLFYTETEVDTLLDDKLNTVDAQSQVTKFTNKDRVNIERLLRYMENDGATGFYTLELTGFSNTTESTASSSTVTSADGEKLPAETEQYIYLCAEVYKDGTLQTGRTDTVTFKLTDGTILGTSSTNMGTGSVAVPSSIYLNLGNTLDEGIYYCYAEATISGSVVKSNIFTLFVKDKNNLLTFNQWSGTEYNNNVTGFTVYGTKYVTLLSTNNYSNIGENSLKIIKLQNTSYWCRVYYNNSIISKTVTASLTFNTKTNIRVYLLEMNNNTTINSVSAKVNGEGNVTLSLTTGSNNTKFSIHTDLLDDIGSYCYIDNIKLTIG